MYPNIYLAVDNCFASKRWTAPEDWAKVISAIGLRHIEASADTELDPLYMGRDYLQDWPKAVRAAESRYGVRVANLFSGHGTYSTLGLTHTDPRVRRHMLDNWFKPLIAVAGELGTGMGFYAHAFSQQVLASPALYRDYCQILRDALCELNCYAQQVGCKFLALEQMYSPHQIPWTIHGTRELMQQVTHASGSPFYYTEDVGHHLTRFLMPTEVQLAEVLATGKAAPWLGNREAYALFDAAKAQNDSSDAACQAILQAAAATPYLFSCEEDGDCYAWLRELGCYSPIIHMQQSDGNSSSHNPFTAEKNAAGIICGKKLLTALKESYDRPHEPSLPSRCQNVYLTLEIFSGTAQLPREILENYKATVEYWRQFIPEDGLPLDQLVEQL